MPIGMMLVLHGAPARKFILRAGFDCADNQTPPAHSLREAGL
jgi:hypothetical protein